jgi:hypothetical protein
LSILSVSLLEPDKPNKPKRPNKLFPLQPVELVDEPLELGYGVAALAGGDLKNVG